MIINLLTTSLNKKGNTALCSALLVACFAARVGAATDSAYVVVAGDTVCEIAEQFSIPCAALIEINQLGKDALILVGQRLVLPSTVENEYVSVTAPLEPQEITQATSSEAPAEPSALTLAAEDVPSPTKTDLFSIYLLARTHDPVFAAQALRREAGKQALPQARAALLPRLTFDSSIGRVYDDDFEHNDSLQSSVSLSQNLYSRPNNISIRQARHRMAISEAEYRTASQDLILRVARSYFLVLTTADNLELSKKNQAAIARQLELALERLGAGLGTRTDLFDAQARYEGAVADGIEGARLLDDARQNLMVLVGQDPGPLSAMSGSAVLAPPDPNEPGPWIDAALKGNHGQEVEKGNVAVAILEVSRRQAARLPTLGASVSGSFTDTEKTDSTRTNISLRLSIPLIQGGMVRAQVKEAALNLEATRYNRESSRRQLRAETRAAFLAISSRLRRIGALAEAVRASGGALQAKEEGFAAGLNTNIEVLDAQRDLFRAQRDYLKERYDYVLELLQLEALIGDLNSDDVRLVNAWLE